MTQALYPTDDVESLRRLATAADVYLQGQLTAAIAADQRALVFAGFLAAATATVVSAALSLLAGHTDANFLGRLAICTAGGLLASMVCAVVAARPARWYFPGSHPIDWREDFAAGKPELDSLQELLADYDDRITKNHATMRANGRWIIASATIGMGTLLVAGIVFAKHAW